MALQLEWDPIAVFGAVAALIVLGVLGNFLFARLRVNDTLLLIAVGVAVGPVLGLVRPESVETVRELVGPLALILILFDGGLALRFQQLLHGLLGAVVLGTVGFAATAAAVGAIIAFVLDVPFTTGLILGSIIGGTSALIVLPSLKHMRTEPRTAATLNLESAITDVLVVVVTFTLVSIVALGEGLDAQDVASTISITFAMSILIGSLVGLLWLWIVPAVSDRAYSYMTTLGVMFALYVLVEWLLQDVSSGGGPLAVLAFGVLLGNSDRLRALGARAAGDFTTGMRRFQGEIAFLVRTFFFIYLGVLVDLSLLRDLYTWALGIVLLAAVVIARYVAVAVTQRQIRLRGDSRILWVMMPRGLAAAVLAAVPASVPYEIPGTDLFVALAFMIIVLTNLFTTIGGFLLERRLQSDPGVRVGRAAKKALRTRGKTGRDHGERGGRGARGERSGGAGRGPRRPDEEKPPTRTKRPLDDDLDLAFRDTRKGRTMPRRKAKKDSKDL
jgi:cell volume regulation protein A